MVADVFSEDCNSSAGNGLSTIPQTVFWALQLCSKVPGSERMPLSEALGRVVSEDVHARQPLPVQDHSAVDGYALGGGSIHGFRIIGRTIAGDKACRAIGEGEAVRIMTGAPVPPGTRAVLMQEHATVEGGTVRPDFQMPEGANIRRAGEDVKLSGTLVKAGTRLDSRHMALLAATGVISVRTVDKVKVAIFSSGNELCDISDDVCSGCVRDSNRPMLKALLDANGIAVTDLGIVPDSRDTIAATLKSAAEDHHLIITSGGVSVGEEDHLKPAVIDAGGTIESWKMAIKPGKPIALGKIGGAVYLGLPGNPLACLVDFLLVGRPVLDALAGALPHTPNPQQARAAFRWERKPGRQEFFPCNVVGLSDEGLPLLERTGKAGSARLMPLVEADGLGAVPADCPDVGPGTRLQFYPFRACLGL